MTFSGSGKDERKTRETREQEATLESEGRSVNTVSKCLLAGVMTCYFADLGSVLIG